jgi:hypothetical protein
MTASSKGWRRMSASVEAPIHRSRIEAALRTYVATWETGDTATRLALFAPDIALEDPATIRRAADREELSTFFSGSIPGNWNLSFRFVRVAVVGLEAILTYDVTLTAGSASPSTLLVNTHVVFGDDGLIHSFRTFFDDEAITDSTA